MQMLTTHLVQYTAKTNGETTHGIARVRTDRNVPSWQECAQQIPGFWTGKQLGPEPTYTLTYTTDAGTITKQLGTAALEKIGIVVNRGAERGTVWDIAVHDAAGEDVTFNFPCFH
jgi:hypothetical protein